ncbi:hypothetical protein JOJ86_001485 [Rhodococcus percolatus]|nr:hypothetical protein [Rhodococcus opacus]MBP2203759.1 hypothetical protein [Rhodococcus opacus]
MSRSSSISTQSTFRRRRPTVLSGALQYAICTLAFFGFYAGAIGFARVLLALGWAA